MAERARSLASEEMIVGLFIDTLSTGGVQRAGRHTAAVAATFAAEHGLPYRFLSLNDKQGLHTLRVGQNEFSVSGYARGKPEFVLSALRASARRPQLVLALHPHLAPVVALMKLRSRRFRSIVFAHGIEVWQPLGWLRGTSLRRADLVTAPSEDTARHLAADQKIQPGKIRHLAWGLDPEFEQRLAAAAPPARPRAFPEHSRIILTVGRWNPAERYKGADTLISALPGLLRTAPDACLVLVGDGQDRPRLEELARAAGVAEQTRFLYGLSQEELFACYAHCDVFALPSRGEGFGLVFLEAMAHGKPVIGGAHGGTPDVVEDGVTGLLVPHGDVAHLARALESLLTDPAAAMKMGDRGRERIQAMYTFERFRSRLTPILEEALAR
jgi:phosphatidylinositol alpha-1,6-mannosyltransferase